MLRFIDIDPASHVAVLAVRIGILFSAARTGGRAGAVAAVVVFILVGVVTSAIHAVAEVLRSGVTEAVGHVDVLAGIHLAVLVVANLTYGAAHAGGFLGGNMIEHGAFDGGFIADKGSLIIRSILDPLVLGAGRLLSNLLCDSKGFRLGLLAGGACQRYLGGFRLHNPFHLRIGKAVVAAVRLTAAFAQADAGVLIPLISPGRPSVLQGGRGDLGLLRTFDSTISHGVADFPVSHDAGCAGDFAFGSDVYAYILGLGFTAASAFYGSRGGGVILAPGEANPFVPLMSVDGIRLAVCLAAVVTNGAADTGGHAAGVVFILYSIAVAAYAHMLIDVGVLPIILTGMRGVIIGVVDVFALAHGAGGHAVFVAGGVGLGFKGSMRLADAAESLMIRVTLETPVARDVPAVGIVFRLAAVRTGRLAGVVIAMFLIDTAIAAAALQAVFIMLLVRSSNTFGVFTVPGADAQPKVAPGAVNAFAAGQVFRVGVGGVVFVSLFPTPTARGVVPGSIAIIVRLPVGTVEA